MIRVSVHPDRLDAVSEFFQLFKTAWAPYTSGDECTVLLTDGTSVLNASADVLILFSPESQPEDIPAAPPQTSPEDGVRVRSAADVEFPVYTSCRFFQTLEKPLLRDESGRVLAYKKTANGRMVIRAGYDLFDELSYLLSTGQSAANAGIATLDFQIDFLRRCILDAGQPVCEVRPCPPGYSYMVCLTHDVDFVSIRSYPAGSTLLGFIRRALIGSFKRMMKKDLSLRDLLKNVAAVLSLPLVHLGLVKDFWMQFDAYRRMEEPFRSTFFLIPFKNRPGEQVTIPYPARRATRYDVEDVKEEVQSLIRDGWEMALHGIDAWRDPELGRRERERVDSVLGVQSSGTRMHWLCRNSRTPGLLDLAGFKYDSTFGYNETVGFRAGTSQVFRPLSCKDLLEIPLHIQDVALFYPAYLDLTQREAWDRCEKVINQCRDASGLVTILWHMRSLAPERLWGGFYKKLLERFRQDGAWVGTAGQTAEWFRRRREITLLHQINPDGEPVLRIDGNEAFPVTVREYEPIEFTPERLPKFSDVVQDGSGEVPSGFYMNNPSSPAVEARAV
jgi:hypothetical protein